MINRDLGRTAPNRSVGLSAFDAVPAVVAYVDSDRRYAFVNEAYGQWLGMKPQGIVGRSLREVVGADAYADVGPAVERALGGEAVPYAQVFGSGTSRRNLEGMYVPDVDEGGRVLGFLVFLLDQSALEACRARLTAESALVHALLRSVPAPVAVLDDGGRFLHSSDAFQRLVGRGADELRQVRFSDLTHPDDRHDEDRRLDAACEGSADAVRSAKRYVVRDERWLSAFDTISAIPCAGGPRRTLVVVEPQAAPNAGPRSPDLRHGTEHGGARRLGTEDAPFGAFRTRELFAFAERPEQAPTPAEAAADLVDRLTGTWSRRGIGEVLRAAIARGGPVGLVLVGIDRLGLVNAAMGQGAGDQVLRDMAVHLLARSHTLTEVGRWAGATFALVIPDARGLDEVIDEGLRAARDMRSALDPEVAAVPLQFRLGAGLCPDPDRDVDALILSAERSLAVAEERGTFNVHAPRRDLVDDMREQAAAEALILQCLSDRHFSLNYQPRVNLKTGAVPAVEALLRLPREQCPMPVGHLIQHAERSGLIHDIGDWVLDEACRQVAAWRGTPMAAVMVSINMSPEEIANPGHFGRVVSTLARHDVDPASLEIEVTESGRPKESGLLAARLDAMRQVGFRISLDDFGEGYTCIREIVALPVDAVKLDRSCIGGIDRSDTLVLEYLIPMLRDLGKHVVAEGVESASQEAWLRRAGCDEGQGFLWSPALPPEQIAAFVARGTSSRSKGRPAWLRGLMIRSRSRSGSIT